MDWRISRAASCNGASGNSDDYLRVSKGILDKEMLSPIAASGDFRLEIAVTFRWAVRFTLHA
jgi:hypothetical protein